MADWKEYRHIEAWGRLLGSYPYFREAQARLAAAEEAPIDACYREGRGRWVRFSEITSPGTIKEMQQELAALGFDPEEGV